MDDEREDGPTQPDETRVIPGAEEAPEPEEDVPEEEVPEEEVPEEAEPEEEVPEGAAPVCAASLSFWRIAPELASMSYSYLPAEV